MFRHIFVDPVRDNRHLFNGYAIGLSLAAVYYFIVANTGQSK